MHLLNRTNPTQPFADNAPGPGDSLAVRTVWTVSRPMSTSVVTHMDVLKGVAASVFCDVEVTHVVVLAVFDKLVCVCLCVSWSLDR